MQRLMYLTIIGFLLVGCSGTKPSSKKDVPDWYLNPPKYEDRFVGVGDALRPQLSLTKKVATARAYDEVARSLTTVVKSKIADYMQASGIGMDASALEFNESVAEYLTKQTLSGSEIEKTEIINGRIFVLVTYDLSEARMKAKETVRNEAKKREALYNEFKARQAFDDLDKSFDDMESSSSVADPE